MAQLQSCAARASMVVLGLGVLGFNAILERKPVIKLRVRSVCDGRSSTRFCGASTWQ